MQIGTAGSSRSHPSTEVEGVTGTNYLRPLEPDGHFWQVGHAWWNRGCWPFLSEQCGWTRYRPHSSAPRAVGRVAHMPRMVAGARVGSEDLVFKQLGVVHFGWRACVCHCCYHRIETPMLLPRKPKYLTIGDLYPHLFISQQILTSFYVPGTEDTNRQKAQFTFW